MTNVNDVWSIVYSAEWNIITTFMHIVIWDTIPGLTLLWIFISLSEILMWHFRLAEPDYSEIDLPEQEYIVEDIIEDIIEWRCWRLNKNDKLKSAFTDNVWQPNTIMVAHPERSSQGIHSFHNAEDAFSMALNSDAKIVGRIQIWGERVVHQKGSRSQYASIHSIDFLFGNYTAEQRKLKLEQLREIYSLQENANG